MHWLGNQSDRYNGVNLLPLEMIETLSRNGQDQCFPSLKGLWSIQGSVKTQIQVQKVKGLRVCISNQLPEDAKNSK